MFILPCNQRTRALTEEWLSKYPMDQGVSDFKLHGQHHGPATELTVSSLSLVIQTPADMS